MDATVDSGCLSFITCSAAPSLCLGRTEPPCTGCWTSQIKNRCTQTLEMRKLVKISNFSYQVILQGVQHLDLPELCPSSHKFIVKFGSVRHEAFLLEIHPICQSKSSISDPICLYIYIYTHNTCIYHLTSNLAEHRHLLYCVLHNQCVNHNSQP